MEISAAALQREQLKFDIAFCSALKRSNQTLNIILRDLNLENIPIYPSWRLNERHYGALTGFNKRQMAEAYGEEQVSRLEFYNIHFEYGIFIFLTSQLFDRFERLPIVWYT